MMPMPKDGRGLSLFVSLAALVLAVSAGGCRGDRTISSQDEISTSTADASPGQAAGAAVPPPSVPTSAPRSTPASGLMSSSSRPRSNLSASGNAGATPGLLNALAINPPDVEDAVNSAPADYDLQMEAGAYYLSFGMYGPAVRHLQAAVRLQPDSAAALVALGDAQMLGRQDDAARQTYIRVRQRWPGNALAYRGLGQLLVRQHQLPAALSLLEQGLRLNPDSFDIQLALGNLYLVYHRYQAAERVLQRAVREHPSDADTHFLLGQAYQGDLHLNAAVREEEAAAKADPTMTDAWALTGMYLVTLQQYAQARPALQTALKLAPQNASYYWGLGNSYYRDKSSSANLVQGIRLYRQAEALAPNSRSVLLSLSSALLDSPDPSDRRAAVPLLERLLRLYPRDSEVCYRLSEAHRINGDAGQAQTILARYRALMEHNSGPGRVPAAPAGSESGAPSGIDRRPGHGYGA